jgi:hypothetical protein
MDLSAFYGAFSPACFALLGLLYVLIRLLAVAGGLSALRTEAALQTLLVFLGFNVAWLLLLDDRKLPHARPSAETE